ncbi:putative tRNA-specific adenosine deaminase [Aspergillus cavernicola]|uniref:tRNA-specific adenosine deaminase n=1 Tax=Aspergillus cavernicola TaxID=176166 RepID=A0ABR4IGM3_9EURO
MNDSDLNADTLPSRIAALVHSHFDGLPKRSKPVFRDDGTAEWIPMTGIVLVKGENTPSETLTCVAVTTGAKCLPASQIPNCKGLVLHDCHAEILAMRAFNFWLLSECHSLLAQENHSTRDRDAPVSLSPYIRRRQQHPQWKSATTPPFELHPDIKIYMYCTCAPCGDASMELTMAAQDDPTPWSVPAPNPSASDLATSTESQLLDGRGHFSKLGIVRRKPARADAESTKSKSCSDKIALRQVSGLLSYETSLLVVPTGNAYIAGLVLPKEEISRVGCARCFGEEGRMKDLKGRVWSVSDQTRTGDGSQYCYEFRPFEILSIPTEQLKTLWPFRKPKSSDPVPEGQLSKAATMKKSKPGTISAVWVRASTPIPERVDQPPSTVIADNGAKTLPVLQGSKTGLFENLINGVRQGHKASSVGVRGASALSRAKLWSYYKEIVMSSSLLSGNFTDEGGETDAKAVSLLQASTYREFKESGVLTECIRERKSALQSAKEVLEGWVPNSGDEDWGLDVLVDSKKRKR